MLLKRTHYSVIFSTSQRWDTLEVLYVVCVRVFVNVYLRGQVNSLNQHSLHESSMHPQ